MTTEVRLWLTGGKTGWQEFRTDHEDMTAVWQDLDGLHIAPLPAEAPLTSLVHAWSDGVLARIRLDGSHARCAVASLSAVSGGQEVEAHIHTPLGQRGDSPALASIVVPDLGDGPLPFVAPPDWARSVTST